MLNRRHRIISLPTNGLSYETLIVSKNDVFFTARSFFLYVRIKFNFSKTKIPYKSNYRAINGTKNTFDELIFKEN